MPQADAKLDRDTLSQRRLLIRAGLLLPVNAPPIVDGGLLLRGDRIEAVAPFADLRSEAADRLLERPNAVLLPGLVNAHCHLELTFMDGLAPPTEDFAAWVHAIQNKKTWANDDFEKSAAAGRRELVRGGCTSVGDVLSADGEAGALAAHRQAALPLRVRAFSEWLGSELKKPERGDRRSGLAVGLSPHAPYSTHPDIYAALLARARDEQLPLSTHLAETRHERDALVDGSGPIAEMIAGIGGSIPHWAQSPIDLISGEAGQFPLQLVHGTWLDKAEQEAISRTNATVVYCPGSVAHFHDGEDPHPVERLLALGVPVALGTDSLASSPTLNMPLTCSLARRAHPGLSPQAILEMATIAGARSLGFGGMVGSLQAGKLGDAVLFELPARAGSDSEAIEACLLSGYQVPSLHIFGGRIHAFAQQPPYPLKPLRANFCPRGKAGR